MNERQPQALIIEDHPDLADIMLTALQEAGYEGEIISNGRDAISRLETTAPDVVALDLQLPWVSGADILRRMRADSRLQKTRVILVTAEPHLARDVEDLADLVLLKPVSFTQLRDLAARLLPGNEEPFLD